MPNKYGQSSTKGKTSRAYSIARAPAVQSPGAYEARKMQQDRDAQSDYAAKALAYMQAMDRKKVAQSAAPSAAVMGPESPFSATGINIVDPPQSTTLPVEAVAPVPKEDPIEEAYKKYLAGIEANRATNTTDSAAIKAAIQGYYSKAAEGNKETYGQSEQDVATMSKNLGTDFASSREGQIINATARDRQEQLDSMQAHNLSSSDRMAQLQGGVYDAYGREGELVKNRSIADRTALELQKQMQLDKIKAEMEAAMMQAQTAASSGGGGGGGRRRSGGGSSSSGSGDITLGEAAEEVSYVNNIGDIEALQGLSPSAQAQFRRIYNLGGGDVTSSLSQGQKLYDDLQADNRIITPGRASGMTYKAPSQQGRISGQINVPKNQKVMADINAALQALTGISGILGTPTTRQKVTSTSKSTKKTAKKTTKK